MHITAHTYGHRPTRFPGLIQRRYAVTTHTPGKANEFWCTPDQYRRIYAWLVKRGAVLNPYNLPGYTVLVYGGHQPAPLTVATPAGQQIVMAELADDMADFQPGLF